MDKVKVSPRVAEAIEYVKTETGTTEEAVTYYVLGDFARKDIREVLNNVPFITIVRALVDGYEVEQTPEEKIAELYFECHKKTTSCVAPPSYNEYVGVMTGITLTLDHLGMKIKGVNC